MKFLLFSVLLAFTVLGASAITFKIFNVAQKTKFPACNTIKTTTIDYNKLVKFSPFHIYQTNVDLFDQSKIVFTGTEPSKVPYTGSSIIIRGPNVITYDLTVIQNSIFSCQACSSDVLANYTAVYSNMVSKKRASWCVVTCADNGIDYTNIVCMGKTKRDYQDMAKYLRKYMPNVPGIFNGQDGVPPPDNCNFFLH